MRRPSTSGSRIGLGLAFLVFGLASGSRATAEDPPARPGTNVVFLVCDDLRPQLGCYGDRLARTPNIDRLAAQGVLFRRAYCQQAVCAPSRASFLSGLRPDSTGIYDLEHPLRLEKPDVITLPQWFRQNGYTTVSLGKIYHHPNDDRASWSRLPARPQGLYADPDNLAEVARKRVEAKQKGLNTKQTQRFVRGPVSESADVPDSAYADGQIAEQAVEQLEQLRDEPFLLCVGFQKPHLPFCAPKRYWDLHPPDGITLPDPTPPIGAPDLAGTNWGELRQYSDIPANGPLDEEQTRRLIRGYRASVSFVDAQIGKVLDAIDRLGLSERTAVVLIGDHGWKLGEHGMWCKHTNFELDAHAPLIVRAPGAKAGAASDALVEYVDIFPTLADLCGLKPPPDREGLSLRPLLAEPDRPWKRAAFSQYPRGGGIMGYSLRTDRWRYTEWIRRGDGTVVARELYDHGEGPLARRNLVDEAGHADTVAALHDQLRAGWRGALPGNSPDPR